MASWLKAAEDLFEVVDRKAKLVVNEIADERQQTVSNGPVSQTKRKKAKPKPKVQKKLSLDESPKVGDDKEDVSDRPILQSDVAVKDRVAPSVENEGSAVGNFDVQTSPEQNHGVDGNRPNIHSSEGQVNEEVKQDVTDEEVPVLASEVEVTTLPSKSEVLNDKAIDVQHPIPASPAKEIEVPEEEHRISSGENQSGETEVFPKIEQEKSESGGIETSVNSGPPAKDVVSVIEPFANQKKQEEPKADRSLTKIQDQSQIDQKKQEEPKADRSLAKIQDQLEEAQGLLKTTASTGQSKEARLARVCAGLSTRLQEYKSENAQLEELLVAERELSKSYETCIQQLQQDLSLSKSEVTRVESGMLEALAAKNSEIEALVGSLETLKKQAALSEGNMASLQANMESIMRNRELTETRMMQAVREELSSAERRAEEERAAHNATKMAAMERERELEHRAVEASTALARIQRTADERTAKAIELEQKVALLEVECSSLNQELQDMEAQVRRGLKKSADEANQVIQTQAWQEEVERARQGQRDAESKLSSLEAEVLKTRVEMAAMKRDAEHYSRQEHVELEKRYRELTDLLYHKQTQLEAMASEKAAVEFQLEKEVKRLQEAQSEAERSKVPRHSSTSWEDDTEMKTLETLPLYQRHMVGVSIQLQKAAKMLDTGAARATRFLWRYPTARLILLLYLVFVHLFLMYLLHRLQERDDVSSTNLTLP